MKATPPPLVPFMQALERGDAEQRIGFSFDQFDRIVVTFSGGKDSLATLLNLLELGVPRSKIELWHHEVDEPGQPFMDWPCTLGYCRSVAEALDLPLLFSRREGGFLRELHRYHAPASAIRFETIRRDGRIVEVLSPSLNRPSSVERSFPALAGINAGRWCSGILKSDVGKRIFTTDLRYKARGRFLYISGERREEGENKYGTPVGQRAFAEESELEKGSTRTRRVQRWRAVIDWREKAVWDIIQRWRIRPHVGYELGFSRLSCAGCIFGDPAQFASFRAVLPKQFERIARAERQCIQRCGKKLKPRPKPRKRETAASVAARHLNIVEFTDQAAPFFEGIPPRELRRLFKIARSHAKKYTVPVVLGPREKWQYPRGAFKKQGGPT